MLTARLLSTASAASATTFGLFYLMQGLVAFEEIDLDDGDILPIINVVYETAPLDPEVKDWAIDKDDFITPDTPKVTDIEPPRDGPIGDGPGGILLTPPRPVEEQPVELGHYNEGDMVPIVRVEPQYPRRSAAQGIEGWVVVEFTVTEYGNVENAFVVEAEPAGYFERASLKAVNKFRYKPRVVGGIARAVPNVRTRFSFNLNE